QFHAMETRLIGAQRIGQHQGVQGIVLGPGYGVAVAKTIQLFRVDGEYGQVVFDQGFHHGPLRYFDGDGDGSSVERGQWQQPIDELTDALAGVLDVFFAEDIASGTDHDDLVTIGRPIDSHVVFELSNHAFLAVSSACRDASSPLYWHSVARCELPTGRASRLPLVEALLRDRRWMRLGLRGAPNE